MPCCFSSDNLTYFPLPILASDPVDEEFHGRVESMVNSGGAPSDFTFEVELGDGAGNLIRQTDSLSNNVTYKHNRLSYIDAVVDKAGQTTDYEVDLRGRILEEQLEQLDEIIDGSGQSEQLPALFIAHFNRIGVFWCQELFRKFQNSLQVATDQQLLFRGT